MKCPECGFDCLPDDVECLACGVDIAAAQMNQEKERIRNIEAAERKAKYELEYKKELGLIPEDDAVEDTVDKTVAEEPLYTCPKCGVERQPESLDCLSCGVVFSRFGDKQGHTMGQSIEGPGSTVVSSEEKTSEIDLNDLEIIDKGVASDTREPIAETKVPESVSDEKTSSPNEVPPKVSSPKSVSNGGRSIRTDAIRQPYAKGISSKKPKSGSFIDQVKQRSSQRLSQIKPGLSTAKRFLIALINNKRFLTAFVAVGLVLIVAVGTHFGIIIYKHQKVERLKREHTEKIDKIRQDYVSRKIEINQHVRMLITNKLFDKAEKEIALYDIPANQNELLLLKKYLKEIVLFEKAKKIPSSEYGKNYRSFHELMLLDPDKETYRKKTAFYKKKYADSNYRKARAYLLGRKKDAAGIDKAMTSIDKSLELYPDSKTYAKIKYKMQTEKLLYYDGNDNIVMAVRDSGMGKKLYSNQRKLTIWVKNISSETIYINVQFFTMVGKDGRQYTYNDRGKRFKAKIGPNEQTDGELYFRTRTRPSKLIFSHLISGEILREFP